jgi:hypothetical protein
LNAVAISAGNSSRRFEGCFAPNSDTFKTLVDFPGVQIIAATPSSCSPPIISPTVPATPPSSPICDEACSIIEKCKRVISNQNQMAAAVNEFVEEQNKIRNSIDKVTGVALGKHFSLSVIVLGVPSLNPDYSMEMTAVVNFNPIAHVYTPTTDHQRVFCPAVKKFLTKLAKFSNAEIDTSSCNWNELAPPTQQAQGSYSKSQSTQPQPQQSSSSSSYYKRPSYNSYTASVKYPSKAVRRVFASTAIAAPADSSSPAMYKCSFIVNTLAIIIVFVAFYIF